MIRIGTNIASLAAQRRLGEAATSLSRTFEQLSSGMRINRASDDAAGLSIANSLNADRRVYLQGIRNLNDGVSLLNVADSAVENLSNLVTRLKELAEQAANGVYSPKQRKALDTEAQALSAEYYRIIKSTNYNARGLFLGNFGDLSLQAGYGTTGSISSRLGGAIGTGTFASAISIAAQPGSATNVALGDVNGDGIFDMVTIGIDGALSAYVNVQLGTGSGSFGSASSYYVAGLSTSGVALGDVNGDGMLDIVAQANAALVPGVTTVLLGTGNGSFSVSASYGFVFGQEILDMKLGDVNSDGNLDIITAGDNLVVRLGTGTGTFGTTLTYASAGSDYNGLALGDLNGDGNLDAVTVDAANGFSVRFGTGTGAFGSATIYAVDGLSTQKVALGDLNQDGNLDLISVGGGTTTVRLNTGSGTFSAKVSYALTGANDIALGDLNGDGYLDMVSEDGSTRLGTGSGAFGAETIYAMGDTDVALGDLNQDGVLDIVTAGGSPGYTNVRLASTSSGISPLLAFTLNSRGTSLQALSQFTTTLDLLAKQRSTIGAFQSRIQFAVNTLQTTAENYAAAENRIRDVDIAETTANLVRIQILQQAAAAVLAQANQQPTLALKLLTV